MSGFLYVLIDSSDHGGIITVWLICETLFLFIHAAFMPRIKAERSFKIESLCNFSEAADQIQKVAVRLLSINLLFVI